MARLNWVGIPGRPEPGVCTDVGQADFFRLREYSWATTLRPAN